MRGDGRAYQRGNKWWIVYWHRGRRYRESAGDSEKDALKLLKRRMGEIHGQTFVEPKQERLTVPELLDALILHLETRGAKSLRSYRCYIAAAKERFPFTRAVDLTTSMIEEFIKDLLAAKLAPATVNRRTAALRQALHLARKQGRLSRVPYVPMLREDNARQGFVERPTLESIVAHLADPVDDIARFAFLTSWRRSEILGLSWADVDRRSGEIRLRTSKNGRPRLLPLTGELADLIERRWARREYRTGAGTSAVAVHVFHRGGRPVKDFRESWDAACKSAKAPGVLFHDLRRSGVRDMVNAGVPQSVAMAISGHRTASMFNRYAIVSPDDMRAALGRTQEYRSARKNESNVTEFPLEGAGR